MKNLCIISLLLFLIIKINASPLHTHYKHSVIIDTDCAIDDMRAICAKGIGKTSGQGSDRNL